MTQELLERARSALRFAASRSAISADDEREILSALSLSDGIRREALPDDVRRLVIAAREVAFGPIADSVRHEPEFRGQMKELDAASEAFADRVPWEMG